MLGIGIIWNTVYQYKDLIINDMTNKVTIVDTFDINLQEKLGDFVNAIYDSENMERWKIENKIAHMTQNCNTCVTVVFFEFDCQNIEYHPFKKKNVYKELEDCKKYIREKYKQYVENYTFDIVFHATDNLDELTNCYNIIASYITENIKDKDKQKIKRIIK